MEIGALASCKAVGASDPCARACDGCKHHLRASLAAIEKAGHRIVPFDPTDAMESAGIEQVDPTNSYKPDVASNVWFAMLNAAPKVTA